MIMTPIHAVDVPPRKPLSTLEDAATDLDTSATLSRAAQRVIGHIRDLLGMAKTPMTAVTLQELNDLETLLAEAREKAEAAQRDIIAFHEGEAAARRSGEG